MYVKKVKKNIPRVTSSLKTLNQITVGKPQPQDNVLLYWYTRWLMWDTDSVMLAKGQLLNRDHYGETVHHS